jgi:hypothetical protein
MQVRLYTENGDLICLGDLIGEGTEGTIHLLDKASSVSNYRDLTAKVYRDDDSAPSWREKKLRLLIQIGDIQRQRKLSAGIAYPTNLLFRYPGGKGKCVGFLMKRIKGAVLKNSVFSSRYLKMMSWTRVELAVLAKNLLKRFINLHNAGILMADVNPFNILVNSYSESGFVDVDSYQVGEFPCLVHVEEYTSPRLLDTTDFSTVFRTMEDEYYAIAVLLFKIFFIEKNPFSKSGGKNVGRDIRERNFALPLGYNRNEMTPHGPWQWIWHNLPFELQEGFYMAFHEQKYLSPSEWMVLIDNYEQALRSNIYPREILLNRKIRELDPIVNTYRDVDPTTDSKLRCFETVLFPDPPQKIVDFAFLEFGTNEIRAHSIQTDVPIRLRTLRFPTRHFDFVDGTGRMDVAQLKTVLMTPNWIPRWLAFVKGIRPRITRLVGFGGVALRYLQNREEVIDTIRETTGVNVGVLTGREEAEALSAECARKLNKSKGSFVLVDVGGTATGIVIVENGVLASYQWFAELGWLTMRKWLFNSAHSDSRLEAEFDAHNGSVAEKLTNCIDIPRTGLTLVGSGVVNSLDVVLGNHIPKGRSSNVAYTMEELESAMDKLSRSLSENRVYFETLADDIRQSETENLSRMVDLRLALPIYIEIMKKLDLDRITVCPVCLHEAVVRSTINGITEYAEV